MANKIAKNDVVGLLHTAETDVTIATMFPVPAYLDEPLKLTLPKGIQGTVEKVNVDAAYLHIVTANGLEVKCWVSVNCLKKVY